MRLRPALMDVTSAAPPPRRLSRLLLDIADTGPGRISRADLATAVGDRSFAALAPAVTAILASLGLGERDGVRVAAGRLCARASFAFIAAVLLSIGVAASVPFGRPSGGTAPLAA